MKLTPHVHAAAVTIMLICCLTGCKAENRTIPANNNKNNIAEAAQTLNVSTDEFEAFLENIDCNYDEYITMLNTNNTTLTDLKSQIESKYDCTYSDYIQTVLTVNNKNTPDENYLLFKSVYSSLDAYIPTNALDDTKTKLKNYDIDVAVADTNEYTYAFDMIAACGGDFAAYVSALNQTYACDSIEFTNITIYGGHGVTKPDETNDCMDRIFVYDEKTNEILEKLTIPTLTLKNSDSSKNITLALSNELGLIFKTTGADSYEKMLKLSNLDIQVRRASTIETIN